MKYRLRDWDLKRFLEQYIKNCHEEFKKNHVHAAILDGQPPYFVKLDENEMKRVLDNLFTNTVRYREKEASSVIIKLEKSGDGKWIQMIFTDDGPGVPEESLTKLFNTFYRVDSSRSHAGKGSGIGLAVVKEIIAGHGGTIHAENHGGLALMIRLPVRKEEPD